MGFEQIIARGAELLWTGGLAATPVAIAVSMLCRCRGVRPATRHLLWVAVLASFVTPVIGSLVWKPHWFRSDRLIAAADSMLPQVQDPPTKFTPSEPVSATPTPVAPEQSPSSEPVAIAPPAAVPLITGPAALGSGSSLATAPVRREVHSPPLHDSAFVGPLPLSPLEDAHSAPAITAPTKPVFASTPTSRSKSAFVGPVYAPELTDPTPGPSLSTHAASPQPTVAPTLAVDVAAPAIGPAPKAASTGGLRTWLVRVLNVRDALADLPPVPLSVWFGGALFIVLLSIWRRCLGMLWLRNATPASPQVQAVVRQVGETLGLARTPRVVFVEAAVSPMIWCGLRPLLVLPTSLWRTLDEDSRRAVLVHELAHVRRWDHVLCWLEAIVGAVYWWHPVVWWARRRLHEEAEASCDAWVTALFPSARRAYASALVVTKSFVSTRAQTRGPWLGVASGSAKRLARRITMVMTHKAAPKVSMLGVFATALVIAAGAFVMPGLACPPDDEEAKAKTPNAKGYVTVQAQNGVAPKAASSSDSGATFFGEAPALEAMKGGAQPTPPTPPAAPTAPMAPRAPKAPKPPLAVLSAPALAQPTEPAPAMVDLEALKEGRTPREYQLSAGKLEAFYSMMSRNDIPILVQMSDDHIVIWGTDDEHAVFGKFIKIVDGNARKPRGRHSHCRHPIREGGGRARHRRREPRGGRSVAATPPKRHAKRPK